MGKETWTIETIVKNVTNGTKTMTVRTDKNGGHVIHSVDDVPSLVVRQNNMVEREEWHCNGNLHREDGPAIRSFAQGTLWREEWYMTGMLHRTDGPAVSEYNTMGSLTHAIWYDRGRIHRTTGPAQVLASFGGMFSWTYRWYLDSVHVPSFEDVLEYSTIEGQTQLDAYYSYADRVSQITDWVDLLPTNQALALVALYVVEDRELSERMFALGAFCGNNQARK